MGVVFDIQRFCVHDGPGLRTTVFLKGCPLRCRWCSNPESQLPGTELLYSRGRCLQCGTCAAACPHAAVTGPHPEGIVLDRERCRLCGSCEDACPTASLVRKGREMRPEEVVREAAKDLTFYRSSGGGVTFSGGEPFMQPDFLLETLTLCREAGIAAAAETSACAEWEAIEPCLPLLDHVIADVKHTDADRHREWTGTGTQRILGNIERIWRSHNSVQLRVPVIPGFNDDEDSCAGLAAFFGRLGAEPELLPYHALGEGKYGMLDRPYPGAAISGEAAAAAAGSLRQGLAARGVTAVIAG